MRERLEGQVVHADDAFPTDERENIDLALDFETRAAVGIAALTSLVAAFLVGQAVARQARSESGDSDALLALGMTRRQVMAAASSAGVLSPLSWFSSPSPSHSARPRSAPWASPVAGRGTVRSTSTTPFSSSASSPSSCSFGQR